MSHALARNNAVVAGLVQVLCTCCERPETLVGHAELDTTRMLCPVTGMTYLDRGDGLYEQDGGELDLGGGVARAEPVPDVLSDRPKRTGPKTRIQLERATFASRAPTN